MEGKQGGVKKTSTEKIEKKIWQLESATAIFPIPLPWEGIIFNFFSQIPLLSSSHVLSSPREMGKQAFHTIGAILFWAELPATVVSGIHASRDKSACQYKSHLYIGHKLLRLFCLFVFPSKFNEARPLARVSSFYIELSSETTRVYKFRKDEENYHVDLNWFADPVEFSNGSRGLKTPRLHRSPRVWLRMQTRQRCILLDATLTPAATVPPQNFPEDWGGGVLCYQKLGFVFATHTEEFVCIWYLCRFCVTYVCTSHSQKGKSQAVGRRRNSRPKPPAFDWERRVMKLQMVPFLFFWRTA